MRKILRTLSIIGIICSLTLGAFSQTFATTAFVVIEKAFPLNESREVEFDPDSEAFEDISPRDRLDQLRDWLLLTTVANAGLSAEDASLATFDLPAIRHSYLQPVSRFDYGDLRSLFIGNGTIIALVPASESILRSDYLAQVADEHRKNQGEMPREIIVFDYQIDLHDSVAHLTRRPTIDAKSFFTEKEGYYERKITSREDLEDILSRVDMITYATTASGLLTVGGRKLKGSSYQRITSEDLAAIWQSEEHIKAREKETAAFNLKIKSYQRKVKQFQQRWENAVYFTDYDKEALLYQHEAQLLRETESLASERRQIEQQGGFARGSGFSLDPTYDFIGLKEYFDKELAPFIPLLLSGNAASLGGNPATLGKIESVSQALEKENIAPLLDLLNDLSKSKNQMTQSLSALLGSSGQSLGQGLLSEIKSLYGFQAARYDGQLKGTEVGMTLFYTDLLAKLWASDYLNSTPSRDIDDFVAVPDIQVSSAHKETFFNQSYTRLWFGPQNKGFQVADGGKSLMIAPVAARIYAAGSNPLEPEKEGEPSIDTGSFLNWWDSHYEELARFEPQYQRLNEIMKWSLLISWLNQENKGRTLGFLSEVKVNRDNWFPEWAKKQPNLRFKDWGEDCDQGIKSSDTKNLTKVCFFPRGYKNSKTEAMPLLVSREYKRFGNGLSLRGGVSLAQRGLFAIRRAISPLTKVSKLVRRSNLAYPTSKTANNIVQTLEGTSYRFSKAADKAIVSSTARQGTKMRGAFGELGSGLPANPPNVNRVFTLSSPGNLSIETRVGTARVGNLDVARTGNSFRVGYRAREVDRAQSLARTMSRADNPEASLLANSHVESYARMGEESFVIRLKGSDRWLHLEASSGSIKPGTNLRVADLTSNARPYSITWLKPGASPVTVGPKKYLTVSTARSGLPVRIGVSTSKIPKGALPFEERINGTLLRGYRNAETGEIFLPGNTLPPQILKNPENLASLVKAPDPVWSKMSVEEGVAKCTELVRSGQYNEAMNGIRGLISTHGPRPELTSLRGITRLSKQSPEIADHLSKALRNTTSDDSAALLNEINIRLAEGAAGSNRVPVLIAGGKRVSLGFKTSGLPELTPASPASINKRAIILVEDTPGLNRLNWDVNTLPTLQQAVELNIGQLYKVSRMKIGNFKPSQLIVELKGPTPTTQPAINYRAHYPRYLWTHSVCDDEADKKDDDCEPEVYIVKAKGDNR